MKFNREHLEELTLQKIKEVNDEAGHRKYLEVPEMVNIIATIMEEKYMQIINDTLRALPVGSIPRHTPESIPERVQDWVKEAAEECMLREKWEACADKLISFAEIIQATEGNATRNPDYYNSACAAIQQYNQLKNETQSHE